MEWSREIDGAIQCPCHHRHSRPRSLRIGLSGDEADIKTALDGPFLAKLNAASCKGVKAPCRTVRRAFYFQRPAHFVVYTSRRVCPVCNVLTVSASPAGVVRTGTERTAHKFPDGRISQAAKEEDDSEDEDASEDAKRSRHKRGEKDSHYACVTFGRCLCSSLAC